MKEKGEKNMVYEYIIALKWGNESIKNNYHKCLSILNKLHELEKNGYPIKKSHFTYEQDINIVAYAKGTEREIIDLVSQIQRIDGVQKVEAKKLVPV